MEKTDFIKPRRLRLLLYCLLLLMPSAVSAEDYGIIVNGVQVTSDNMNAIREDSVGVGHITFDGDHTLTLSNVPNMVFNGAYPFIQTSMDLTINLVGESEFDCGNSVFITRMTGDNEEHTVTFTTDATNPGKLVLTCGDYFDGFVKAFENGLSWKPAGYFDEMTPEDYGPVAWVGPQSLGVKVAGHVVTAFNAGNVLNDTTSSVSFNATTNTLTFNEVEMDLTNNNNYPVVSNIGSLNVELKGYNTITLNNSKAKTFYCTNADQTGTLTLSTVGEVDESNMFSYGNLRVSGISDQADLVEGYEFANEMMDYDDDDSPEVTGWYYSEQEGTYSNVFVSYIEYYDVWQGSYHLNSSGLSPESGGTYYDPLNHTLHLSAYGYFSDIKSGLEQLIVEVNGSNWVRSFQYVGEGNGTLLFREEADGSSNEKTVNISNEEGAITGFSSVVIESPLKVVTPETVPETWDASITDVVITNLDYYSLWISGEQVTSANKDKILYRSEYNEEKEVWEDIVTATYDPDTNVLTLDNAEITTETANGVEFGVTGLTVYLMGESTITCYNDDGVAFHSTVANNTITFTTDAKNPGSLYMTTLNDPITGATAVYRNGLGYENQGDSKIITSQPVELDISYAQNSREWATYCATEMSLETPDGLQAYIVSNVRGTTVTVQAIDYIPQGVGVLLQRTTELEEPLTANAYTGTEGSFSNSLLTGTAERTDVTKLNSTAYVLYNDEFVKSTSGYVPANRAYYLAPIDAPVGSRLSIVFEDAPTAVTERFCDTTDLWYTIDGRRLDKQPAEKGVYIRNGKKIIIK